MKTNFYTEQQVQRMLRCQQINPRVPVRLEPPALVLNRAELTKKITLLNRLIRQAVVRQ